MFAAAVCAVLFGAGCGASGADKSAQNSERRQRLLHLGKKIVLQERRNLTCLGMHNSVDSKVQFRLVKLKQFVQLVEQFLEHARVPSNLSDIPALRRRVR